MIHWWSTSMEKSKRNFNESFSQKIFLKKIVPSPSFRYLVCSQAIPLHKTIIYSFIPILWYPNLSRIICKLRKLSKPYNKLEKWIVNVTLYTASDYMVDNLATAVLSGPEIVESPPPRYQALQGEKSNIKCKSLHGLPIHLLTDRVFLCSYLSFDLPYVKTSV